MLEFLLVLLAIVAAIYFLIRIYSVRITSAVVLKMLAFGIDGLQQEIDATKVSDERLEKKKLLLPLLQDAHAKANKLHLAGKYKEALESLDEVAKKLKSLRSDTPSDRHDDHE